MEYLDLKAHSISLEQKSISEEAGFCFKVPSLVTQEEYVSCIPEYRVRW